MRKILICLGVVFSISAFAGSNDGANNKICTPPKFPVDVTAQTNLQENCDDAGGVLQVTSDKKYCCISHVDFKNKCEAAPNAIFENNPNKCAELASGIASNTAPANALAYVLEFPLGESGQNACCLKCKGRWKPGVSEQSCTQAGGFYNSSKGCCYKVGVAVVATATSTSTLYKACFPPLVSYPAATTQAACNLVTGASWNGNQCCKAP